MGWLHRAPGLDSAVPMLCPSYSGVPTGGLAQALPTWGLRKAEPGQAGNGAAQMPRNREFLERRAEQWLPTCRWAYLDCVAHLPAPRGRIVETRPGPAPPFGGKGRLRSVQVEGGGAVARCAFAPFVARTRARRFESSETPPKWPRANLGYFPGPRPANSKNGRATCRLNSLVVDGATTAPTGSF